MRVHRAEEAVVLKTHQLAISGKALQRLALEDAIVIAQVIENFAFEDEKAGGSTIVGAGLLHEVTDASVAAHFESAETRDGTHGRHGCNLAVAAMELDQVVNIDVADTVAVSEQEAVAI